MKKINAHNCLVCWSGGITKPVLVFVFTRTENINKEWYEIHIKLTPDFVHHISLQLKKYIAAWWKGQQDKMAEIQEHLKF